MSENSKSDSCATCASLLTVATSVMTSNSQLTSELLALHGAMGHRSVVQSSASIDSMKDPTTTPIIGSGASSRDVYEEMRSRNWHGRLGRTTMSEVDRMLPVRREELDIYLHLTLNLMFPVGSGYADVKPDEVFARLAAFGLRLEDRGAFADGPIFIDSNHMDKPTTVRLQNFTAHFYAASTQNFGKYWKASAMETLLELARYRGLVTANGFLKGAK